MPIYVFECGSCGYGFDRLQKLSDPDPKACPQCAAQTVQRQLTAPQFRLAGSGWYETDFKQDNDKKRNLVDKGEASKSDATPETKSESKPESKPDSKVESKPDNKPNNKPAATSAPPPAAPTSGTTAA